MKKLIFSSIAIILFIFPFLVAADQMSLKNKFGFSSGELNDKNSAYLDYTGAGWVRPHLGPIVWDIIQPKQNADYDWDIPDQHVAYYQELDLNLMFTIWPFATWDQKNRKNAKACRVLKNDEKLKEKEDNGKYSEIYLPRRRCNPNDWEAYEQWVMAVVERYDGDGEDDMPDLKYGVKYWEVMNEPDLAPGTVDPDENDEDEDESEVQKDDEDKKDKDDEEDESLDFYQQNYKAYYKLLKRTYTAIKQADPDSKVLIAGAAGDGEALEFYENIFKKYKKAKNYFDIGNVHCIGTGKVNNLNVKPYKRLLQKYRINKKIWVTESEVNIEEKPKKNYAQMRTSVKKALAAGASKIFFNKYTFDNDYGSTNWKYSKKKFKIIIDKFNK